MLSALIKREILDHLKSLRMLVIFLLLALLMAGSALVHVHTYHEQSGQFAQRRSESLKRLAKDTEGEGGMYRVFSYNWAGRLIFMEPNKLGFISEGLESRFPNAFRPSAFRVYGPLKLESTNMFMRRNEPFDWALIVGIVLSFSAIVLTYDGLCGERERGTLRLVLSYPLSKSLVILSKYAGTLSGIVTALLFSCTLSLLILNLGGVPLGPQDLLFTGMAVGISVLYVSVFLLLGLFISGSVSRSSSSLVISLLIWVLLVIVIPGTGGLIASKVHEIKARDIAERDSAQAESDAKTAYEQRYPELDGVAWSGHWSPGEPLGRAYAIADAWQSSMNEYRNSMIEQVMEARRYTLVSPASCFSCGLEAAAGSGIVHYARFHEQINEYHAQLRQYLTDMYPQPLNWHAFHDWDDYDRITRDMQTVSKVTVDIAGIPRFSEERAPLRDTSSAVLPYAALLFLFNALFFTLAFVRAVRYDVR